jgi:hypothetical protein
MRPARVSETCKNGYEIKKEVIVQTVTYTAYNIPTCPCLQSYARWFPMRRVSSSNNGNPGCVLPPEFNPRVCLDHHEWNQKLEDHDQQGNEYSNAVKLIAIGGYHINKSREDRAECKKSRARNAEGDGGCTTVPITDTEDIDEEYANGPLNN